MAAVNCRFSHSHSFYSLAYLDGSQSVVIGDGHGDLSLFDMRQRTVMFTQKQVHHKAIRTIAVDPSKAYFATGSTDGKLALRARGMQCDSQFRLNQVVDTAR